MSDKFGTRLKKLLAAGIVIFVIIYLVMFIVSNGSNSIRTETATYARVSDTVELESWVIRDEQLISQSKGGVLAYQLDDGERIESGGVIAKVYLNESDAAANSKAALIESEINNIRSLSTAENLLSGNIEAIGSRISETIISSEKNTWNGEYNAIQSDKSSIQYYLSEKRIVLGYESQDVISSRISALESERNQLLSSSSKAIGEVVTSSAGYFSSNIDGYESLYNVEDIGAITVSDIDSFSEFRASKGNFCGRVCSSFKWYVAARVNESQKIKIEDAWGIKLKFRTSGNYEVSAKLFAMNPDKASGDYACIFECSNMNADIINLRNEAVTVIIEDYAGVLVSEKAVHFVDVTEKLHDENGNVTEVVHENVKGVFVKNGERLRFVQIFTDKTINGFCVCRTDLTENDKKNLVTSGTIKLYDEVVVGGKNLYDGKIIT